MINTLLQKAGLISAPPDGPQQAPSSAPSHVPIQTVYRSNAIAIPPDFLTVDPPDLEPIIVRPLDWAATPIPENKGLYAVILDNVISPSECAALLRLAEASASATAAAAAASSSFSPPPSGAITVAAAGSVDEEGKSTSSSSAWGPALVNMGMGYEVRIPDYRNGERIIWDQQDVVDRLWGRCLRAEGVAAQLGGEIRDREGITGPKVRWRGKRAGKDAGNKGKGGKEEVWRFKRVNERMRFLRYEKGGFFRREYFILFLFCCLVGFCFFVLFAMRGGGWFGWVEMTPAAR